MADNMSVTPGSGRTVAADDVGGVLFQRVKITHGADGVATDTSTTDPLPISLFVSNAAVSPTNPIPVGKCYNSTVTITRPDDATPYAVNDVMGSVITLSSIGPSAGYVMVSDIQLRFDVSSVPSGMSNMRLHLYSASPASAYTDNAAWDLPAGDRASYLGYIDIGTPVDLGSTLWVERSGISKIVKLATSSTTLYAYLTTAAAFTPSNTSVLSLNLTTMAVG